MKKLLCVLLVLVPALAYCAETIKIDFRYNTLRADEANRLRWQTKDVSVKDRFDAVSGASVAQSTKLLRALQASGRTKLFPKGLYALLLFAVSPFEQSRTDLLTVQTDGARLTVSFLHRGNAYKITTDKKGRLHTRSGFLIAEGLAENKARVFSIKSPYLISAEAQTPDEPPPPADPTDMRNLDWENVPFLADDYDESAEAIWDGTLSATYKDGVLTITGKLKKIAPPEKPKPEKTAPAGGVTGDVPPLEGGAKNGSEADG